MDNFFERQSIPKFMQEEIRKKNRIALHLLKKLKFDHRPKCKIYDYKTSKNKHRRKTL